jgi:hypothetical protein
LPDIGYSFIIFILRLKAELEYLNCNFPLYRVILFGFPEIESYWKESLCLKKYLNAILVASEITRFLNIIFSGTQFILPVSKECRFLFLLPSTSMQGIATFYTIVMVSLALTITKHSIRNVLQTLM